MMSSWRVMGMWKHGPQFLVLLGATSRDCKRGLQRALEGYSLTELEDVECLWLEEWDPGSWCREPDWIPREEIRLRPLKLARLRQCECRHSMPQQAC